MNKRNIFQDVLEREYDVAKYVLACNDEVVDLSKYVTELLSDKEYQKEAIKVKKNMFNMKSLNGIVAPAIMLINSNEVDQDIIKTLVHNLIFEYQDEKKKISLAAVKDLIGMPYINYILDGSKICLKDEEYTKAAEIVQQLLSSEFHFDTLLLFLLHYNISFELKKKVISNLSMDTIDLFNEKFRKILEYKTLNDFTEFDLHILNRLNGDNSFSKCIKLLLGTCE